MVRIPRTYGHLSFKVKAQFSIWNSLATQKKPHLRRRLNWIRRGLLNMPPSDRSLSAKAKASTYSSHLGQTRLSSIKYISRRGKRVSRGYTICVLRQVLQQRKLEQK